MGMGEGAETHGRRGYPWRPPLKFCMRIFLDLQGGTKISEVDARDFNMQTYKKLLPGTPLWEPAFEITGPQSTAAPQYSSKTKAEGKEEHGEEG